MQSRYQHLPLIIIISAIAAAAQSYACPVFLGDDTSTLAWRQAAAKVDAAVQRAKEHLRRRALLLGFSRDPTQFINDLVATQVPHLHQRITRMLAWPCMRRIARWL